VVVGRWIFEATEGVLVGGDRDFEMTVDVDDSHEIPRFTGWDAEIGLQYDL